MATQYAGLDLGAPEEDTSFDTSTTSSEVEISYDDTAILSTADLVVMIEKIKSAILKQTSFPAA